MDFISTFFTDILGSLSIDFMEQTYPDYIVAIMNLLYSILPPEIVEIIEYFQSLIVN